ncbi:cysteine proteinase [Wallemia mellicola]|nr:cysteine proteinase [Wallemia mellicola]
MSEYLENLFSSVSNILGNGLFNSRNDSKRSQRPSTSNKPQNPLSLSSKSKTIQKGHKKRPHILSVQHFNNAQLRKIKLAFQQQQSRGYAADFATFQGYYSFKQRVDQLNLGQNIPPSTRTRKSTEPWLDTKQLRSDTSFKSAIPKVYQLSEVELAKLSLGPKPELPTELTADEQSEFKNVMSLSGKISKCGRQTMMSNDLKTLMPRQWLNDEVINFYAEMLRQSQSRQIEDWEKHDKKDKKPFDAYIHSTFLFSTLESSGYDKAKLGRWVKKVDLFGKDIIIFPINRGQSHWVCGAINMRKKRFEMYDSMGGGTKYVYQKMREYINREHETKKGKPFDFDGWIDFWSENTPTQDNGFDCGVFTCCFMDALSKGKDVDDDAFEFSQKHMKYLRKRATVKFALKTNFGGCQTAKRSKSSKRQSSAHTHSGKLKSVAASLAACLTHPLDLTKVRMQTTAPKDRHNMLKTMIMTVKDQASQDNNQALLIWSFVLLVLVHSEVLQVIQLVSRALLIRNHITLLEDIILVRMTSDATKPAAERMGYRNALHGLFRMTKDEGINSLFRGLGPNTVRAILMNASQLASYDYFKRSLVDYAEMEEGLPLHFSASFLAGTLATTVCSPADVIKSRVMSESKKGGSIAEMFKTSLKNEGPGFLFRGWTPAWIRLCPNSIAIFVILEQLRWAVDKARDLK